MTITRVSRAKFFWKKPLKNTSVVAVRMTVSKGNLQKMFARTYPCIYPCNYLRIYPCIYPCNYLRIYPCIYPCNYSRTYPCIYQCTHRYTYPCTCLCIYLCTHPCTYSRTYRYTYSCTYPCFLARTLLIFLRAIHPSFLILSNMESIDRLCEIASSVLYVISYALFFGLGKVHMVGTCLVMDGHSLVIY